MARRIKPIARSHDRRAFDCGDPDLNDYLRRYARQNHDSGGAKTFVAVGDDAPARVLGYYSIAPASVAFERVPPGVLPGLGRYPVPAYRLARLAVHLSIQGQGLGGELLVDASSRALAVATEIGGVGLLIDAKNDRAAAWYARFGASTLTDGDLELLLPFATIRAAFDAAARPS